MTTKHHYNAHNDIEMDDYDNDDPCWTEVVCDSNQAQVGRTLLNPLSSPLKHTAWLILVLAWSFLAIGLVIANFILKAL